MIVRVTKIFQFEMAHALFGHDGPCKNIHGHSYELSVTVIGKINTDVKSPKQGMVIDFSDLKRIVKSSVIDKFDHALVLNEENIPGIVMQIKKADEKLITTPFQPTSENLLVDFANTIQNMLPVAVKLHHLKLKETSTSFAEWHAEDNR